MSNQQEWEARRAERAAQEAARVRRLAEEAEEGRRVAAAKRKAQEEAEAARAERVEAQLESKMRAEIRSAWIRAGGDESTFESAYPELRAARLRDDALRDLAERPLRDAAAARDW